MKKFTSLFFLLILIFTTQSISAQVRAGIIGGLNFADLKTNNDVKNRTLFGIGGIFQYSFNDNFSIIAEPMYLKKGGISIEENNNPEITIKMDFIQLPLYLKYSFPLDKYIKPYLIVGPSVGYRTSSEIEAEIYGVTFKSDLKHLTKAIDWEVALGTGIEVPFDKLSFFIEGTYTWGLTDLRKIGEFQATAGDVSITGELDDRSYFKTRGLQLLMGFSVSI